MTYPLTLAYGEISVYRVRGTGTVSPIHSIPTPANFNWGTVYQISDYGIVYTSLGQWVLFNGASVVCKLAIGDQSYQLLPEVRVVATENNY